MQMTCCGYPSLHHDQSSVNRPNFKGQAETTRRARDFGEVGFKDGRGRWNSSEASVNGRCCLVFLDLYSSIAVFVTVLVTLESALYSVVAVGFTVFYYNFHTPERQTLAANLSWTFLSLAVVLPLTICVNQAFTRRDRALQMLCRVKALMLGLCLGHNHWDWFDDRSGKQRVPALHGQAVKGMLTRSTNLMCDYLRAPSVSRAMHMFTSRGRRQRRFVRERQREISRALYICFCQLSLAVEILKREGLPANEASRMNQYLWLLSDAFEQLKKIKEYRTPQALRSFVRLGLLFLPSFYAPYFVWVATGENPDGIYRTNLVFAVSMSVLKTLILVGLFAAEQALEDPFHSGHYRGFDTVRLSEEFRDIEQTLDDIYDVEDLPWTYSQHSPGMSDVRGMPLDVWKGRARKAEEEISRSFDEDIRKLGLVRCFNTDRVSSHIPLISVTGGRQWHMDEEDPIL